MHALSDAYDKKKTCRYNAYDARSKRLFCTRVPVTLSAVAAAVQTDTRLATCSFGGDYHSSSAQSSNPFEAREIAAEILILGDSIHGLGESATVVPVGSCRATCCITIQLLSVRT